MPLGRLSVVMDANIAKFESDLGRAARIAQQQSQAMQRAFQRASDNIAKNLTGALAGYLSVRGLGDWMKGAVNGMLQVGIAAKQVALPVAQFAALSQAAKDADVDVQTFAASLKRADVVLASAQGGDKAANALFKQLGIDPATIRDNTDLINKVADSFSRYADGAGKTAAAQMLFGRSGAAMIGFLDQGSAAIQKQTDAMTELQRIYGPDAQQMLAGYDAAQKELAKTLDVLGKSIAIAIVPALQSATEYISGMIHSMDKEDVSAFTATLNILGRTGIVLASSFNTLGHAIGAAGAAGYLAVHGQFREALGVLQQFGSDTEATWRKAALQITNFGQQAAKALGAPGGGGNKPQMPVLSRISPGRALAAPKAPTDPTQQLRDQLLQLTLTTKQYQLYQIAQKGATDTQMAYASRVIDTIDALKAQQKAQDDVNNFLEQNRAVLAGITDAQQTFNDNAAEAIKALNAHAINTDQFNRYIAQQAELLEQSMKGPMDRMSEYAKRAAQNMQDAFASFLFDPFKDGLGGMLNGFADTLRQMAAQALSAQIFDSLGGWGKSNSGGGGFLGALAGFVSNFGGGRAGGGAVTPATMYRVNERGPELLTVGSNDYLMMGNRGGRVTPAGAYGGTTINVAVQPTSSRQTATQIAQAIARQQQLAMARR